MFWSIIGLHHRSQSEQRRQWPPRVIGWTATSSNCTPANVFKHCLWGTEKPWLYTLLFYLASLKCKATTNSFSRNNPILLWGGRLFLSAKWFHSSCLPGAPIDKSECCVNEFPVGLHRVSLALRTVWLWACLLVQITSKHLRILEGPHLAKLFRVSSPRSTLQLLIEQRHTVSNVFQLINPFFKALEI